MNRRQLLRQLSAVAGASALPVLPAFADTNKILLGQSAPLSGPAKELGEQFRDGAQLAFEYINQRGGVNGRRIELRSLDDGYEPERCAANTRKLLDEGVTALFGYVGTPTSLAALPLATAARVPFFAPFTGAEALRTPFNRYAFHIRASYNDECDEIVQQLKAVGVKKVAVFYQNDAYGQAGLAGIQAALKHLGLAPVATATVERNSVEVTAAVKAIMAAQPEAIVQISAYKTCAAFIRQARQAMFLGNFYNLSFVGAQALAAELGKDASGVVVSQVVPFPFTGTNPLAAEYAQRAKAFGNKELGYTGMEGYLAAKVLIEGLRRAGNAPTSDNLISSLEGMKDFDAGGFFVNFNSQKHTGSKYVDMTILTSDGKVRR
ncbi:ABC-type branched-chain amino acid transport system, substrate-binding protein [Roseateles sp. YR242]|uniref:ABC transporter substrate-binding protein n=1 Tax=Roseateles sp. YR242 TaxID=1855305 RepID=UPI0008B860DE|nr:ABC transporter substrate-binding protein [Roseateles sp. YR242]SEL90751.1 ABC-type branched-chain amino acid transport system, substrate-binding protein [Roseateles sp. YR242]